MSNSTPTLSTDSYGTRRWRLDGLLHRTDGPAFEQADGHKAWCAHGNLHRTDGPAVEFADGSKGWWVKGEDLSMPYASVLTAAFARGLPIPPGVLTDMLKAISEADDSQDGELNRLNIILHKYWPTHVKNILTRLFSDSDPGIKNLAFLLLGRGMPRDRGQVSENASAS